MGIEKAALDGRFVRLEPLEERHRAAIRPAAQHPEIFAVTTSALGALYDPFRKHMIMADGHVRDSVYFSIIDTDWPQVKAGLEKRLAA